MPQFYFELIQFGDGLIEGLFVVGFDGQLQQSGYILQSLMHLVDGIDDTLQGGTLFAQCLCTLRFIPYVRLLQLGVNFF
ncbi:hypothetical protein ETAR_04760 [Edwardsiella tarda]|nr:hypothetical protein GBS0709_04770 [Edwardsiella tarda]